MLAQRKWITIFLALSYGLISSGVKLFTIIFTNMLITHNISENDDSRTLPVLFFLYGIRCIKFFGVVFISEIKFIGFKNMIIIFLIISLIFLILGDLMKNKFILFFIVSTIFLGMASSSLFYWLSLIFPTRVRDNGVTICELSSQFFITIFQGIVIYFIQDNVNVCIVIIIVIISIGIIVIIILPKNQIQNTDTTIDVINISESLEGTFIQEIDEVEVVDEESSRLKI